MKTYTRHYGEAALIHASASDIFTYVDDHRQFSSHMSQPSWQMGGGSMEITTDEGNGQRVGSHMKLKGVAFGIPIYLDGVITIHEYPVKKEWETTGDLNLLVVGPYKMGVILKAIDAKQTRMTVFIDYDMPSKFKWLGFLFGSIYAKWCVRQMLHDTRAHFRH